MIAAGAAAVTVAAGVALVFVVGRFLLPSTDDLGPHPMDAASAARAMQLRRIVIPDGFTFEEGTALREFVGADGYVARYRAAGDFEAAVRAVGAANPDFPAPHRAPCTDEIVATGYPGLPWFECRAGMRVAVTTRSVNGADVAADHFYGTPPDAETLLVAETGGEAELFALSAGH